MTAAKLSLSIICVTVLIFTWMTRGSLGELHIRQGGTEVFASLAYQPER